MAVGFVASASSGSQASVATFNIGTLGTGARAGIVFVCTHNSASDIVTGVTWNSVAMNLLYSATDTDTEPGRVEAYFLDNVTNGTITVSRTNNATVTVGYAASISASGACQAFQTITRVASTQNTDADTSTTGTGASGEVSVDDGSPGTNSMRFSAAYSGGATPPLQGTNSTNLQVLDSTAFGSRFVRETTAGQGSRSVGFATGTTDDWALVAVAVREQPAGATGTGAGTGQASTATGDAAETMTGTGGATQATPSGAYVNAVRADSPVAYWRMGEASGSVVDSAGSNHGTASGTVTRDVTGALAAGDDGAITFGGGYVAVPDHASLDLGDVVTVEAWVSSAVGGGDKGIVGKDTGTYYIRLDSADNRLRFLKANIASIVTSTTTVPGTGWHHVAATKNGATVKLYIDGADVTGTVTNATLVDNALDLYIGSADIANEKMTGSIDEVAVYGTALSAARVLAHYNAAQPTGAGLETFSGTGAGTQAVATATGDGTSVGGDTTGTGAGTQAAATAEGTATETFTGTGSGTQAAQSASGTGTGGPEEVTGTGAGTQAVATATGDGLLTLTGTGAGTQAAATAEGAAAETFTGTGSGTQAAATASGDGTSLLAVTGTGAGIQAPATAEGSGTQTQPVTGTGAGTQQAATASGTGIGGESAPVEPPSSGHGVPLRAAKVVGPAKPRLTVLRPTTGTGHGSQPAASASGTGNVNDDELVLLVLEAA